MAENLLLHLGDRLRFEISHPEIARISCRGSKGDLVSRFQEQFGFALPPEPLRTSSNASVAALATAPHTWLVKASTGVLERSLRLKHVASVLDMSDAEVVLRIQGRDAVELLSTACPLDLSDCPPGRCANTRFGAFNVLLHPLEKNGFDLHVARSYARDCQRALRRSAESLGNSGEPHHDL